MVLKQLNDARLTNVAPASTAPKLVVERKSARQPAIRLHMPLFIRSVCTIACSCYSSCVAATNDPSALALQAER